MTAASNSTARKRQAEADPVTTITMHTDAHNGLTTAEQEAILNAFWSLSGDPEVSMLAAVARIKAEAVQAERQRLAAALIAKANKDDLRNGSFYLVGLAVGLRDAAHFVRGEGS